MRAHRLLIPLAAFLAILPLLLTGPSCGHDFDFHLLNWLEANTQLTHLQYPRWAYTPAYNAGEPRFLFYPPLSWLIGAALTQMLPFHFVPIAFTFLCLTLAGLALHRLASPYATPAAATIAAILYTLNPYMLFTAYERTAFAELLAAAFIPLLFAAILRPHPTIPAIALPVALLWLTNAPAAVMSSYALALLTLVRLALGAPTSSTASSSNRVGYRAKPDRLSLAITSTLGTLLGLALAAFYIIPAAYQRRYVAITMAIIPGMSPADNFLFHHTGLTEDAIAHDAVLHTASLIAILLITATAITLVACHSAAQRRNLQKSLPTSTSSVPHSSQPYRDEWVHLLPLTVLAAVITLLLTPISLPIWTHTPQLAFLQFPWRLLALLAPILALTLAIALSRIYSSLFPLPSSLLLAAILIPVAWHLFHQSCDTPDTPEARAALYHSPLGTEPTDEYTPKDADPDALHPEGSSQTDPPFWLIPQSSPVDTPAPPTAAPGPAQSHLSLTLSTPETLILNRRQYPLWLVTLNHHEVSTPEQQRQDGLIAIPLPAGQNIIDLTQRHTPDELLGLALSFFGAIILLALRIRHPLHSAGAD